MKKFVIKLVCFCTIVVVFTLAVNARYVSVRNTSGTDKFKNVPDDIQICNFGSSHGQNDYYYDLWQNQYKCFNFAMSSQSLDYDWRIMQCYQDKISEGAIVFITISYFSFYGIDETLTDKFLSKNKRYYRFLPKEYIKDFDFETYIFETKLPSLTAYESLISNLINGTRDSDEIENAENKDLKKYAEEAYKRHLVNEKLDENGNRIVNHEYINALYNMIALCEEKGATPVLVTTPYLQDYTNVVMNKEPEFLDEFYGMIEEVVQATGVKYYDYSRDARFKDKYELFIDVDHLNHDGAVKFVDILMKDVMGK